MLKLNDFSDVRAFNCKSLKSSRFSDVFKNWNFLGKWLTAKLYCSKKPYLRCSRVVWIRFCFFTKFTDQKFPPGSFILWQKIDYCKRFSETFLEFSPLALSIFWWLFKIIFFADNWLESSRHTLPWGERIYCLIGTERIIL